MSDLIRLQHGDCLELKQEYYDIANERVNNAEREETMNNLNDLIAIVQAWIDRQDADGCLGCAFEDKDEWQLPCCRCKRNCKDYWRRKEGDSDERPD